MNIENIIFIVVVVLFFEGILGLLLFIQMKDYMKDKKKELKNESASYKIKTDLKCITPKCKGILVDAAFMNVGLNKGAENNKFFSTAHFYACPECGLVILKLFEKEKK
ncbi:MAG: hypothetical protein WC438_05925 [Candidatus Pacearchaeota archaeon]|jgi:hypothetical protein